MGMFKNLFTWWEGASLGTVITSRRNGEEVGRDEAGNVRDIDQEIRADGFGNGLKPRKVQCPRIRARADDNHPWTAFFRLALDSIIIDDFRLPIHAVAE